MRRLILLYSLVATILPGLVPTAPAMAAANRECVILLHGLGRTAASMKAIEQALVAEGYHTWNQSYPSTSEDIATLSKQAITPAVAYCEPFQRTHFVTHSLGGILVRQYLQNRPLSGRVVMLSPPNHGSEIPDLMAHLPLFDTLLGPAAMELGTGDTSVPNQLGQHDPETTARIGVISGNRTSDPWFSGMIAGDDDGKVSLNSARLAANSPLLVMPYGHTFIAEYQPVIQQVLYFLANGRFARVSDDQQDQ